MTSRGLLDNLELLLKSRPPTERWPPDPSNPLNDALVAFHEKVARLKIEAQRIPLAQHLSQILYPDLRAETEKSFGSPATRAAYKLDFKRFQEWCIERELPCLPSTPEVVAIYLISVAADVRPERLHRIVNAVAYFHEWADKDFRSSDVIIKAALRFCRRAFDEEQAKQAAATTAIDPEPQINGSGLSH